MSKITIRSEGNRCERCGHEWIPRSPDRPRVCPDCKSPYWDRPVRRAANGKGTKR